MFWCFLVYLAITLMGPYLAFGEKKNPQPKKLPIFEGRTAFSSEPVKARKIYSSTPLPPYHHQRDSLKTPPGRYVGLINSHWFQFW